jgi:GT2 family glycosyltransferase
MKHRESAHLREIDIVIPTYNGKQFLETCLGSVFSQSFKPFQVTVVDNGSTDDTVEYVRNGFQDVRLIALDVNRGFGAAVNAGIAAGTAPLVFLLNNDTELEADCLAELAAAAAESDDDFFAPKMLSFHQRDILDGAGEGFLRGGVGYRLGTMERDGELYNRPRRVFGACAGAALYRRAMLERLGLFDEDFFAYLEDVDLNFRANRMGFTCRYVPAAKVFHIGSATSGSRINPFTVRLSTRNNFFLLLKNYPLSFFIRFLVPILIYQFFWFLFVIKKGQFGSYLSGAAGFIGNIGPVLAKRKEALAGQNAADPELVRRILAAERDVIVSIMRRRQSQDKGNGLLKLYSSLFL